LRWWAGVNAIEGSQVKTFSVRRRVSNEVVHELIRRVFPMAGAISRPRLTTAALTTGQFGAAAKLWLTIGSSLKLTRLA
jgi:hypothetical protein